MIYWNVKIDFAKNISDILKLHLNAFRIAKINGGGKTNLFLLLGCVLAQFVIVIVAENAFL